MAERQRDKQSGPEGQHQDASRDLTQATRDAEAFARSGTQDTSSIGGSGSWLRVRAPRRFFRGGEEFGPEDRYLSPEDQQRIGPERMAQIEAEPVLFKERVSGPPRS